MNGGGEYTSPGVAPTASSRIRLVPRRDPARDAEADAGEDAGLQLVGLAVGVQHRRARQRRGDLLLAVVRVVVLRDVLEVRREVLDLHAVTPRLARARQNPPPFGDSNSAIVLIVQVVGIPDERYGEVVVAFVRREAGAQLTPSRCASTVAAASRTPRSPATCSSSTSSR